MNGDLLRKSSKAIFYIFVGQQSSLLFHLLLLLQLAMISHVTDYLGCVANSKRLGVVGDLCHFAFLFLEVFVVFHLTLQPRVLGEAAAFRCISDSCCPRLRTMPA